MKTERWLGVAALTLLSLLPAVEMGLRHAGLSGLPGASAFIQHLTLWVAFLGAAMAAASDRLLSMSGNTFLAARWTGPVRVATSGVTAAVALCLAWASLQFVLAEREGGALLTAGVPKWTAEVIMPAGFLLIAIRAVFGASDSARLRSVAAVGLLVPVALYFLPPHQGWLVWGGSAVLVASSVLGLPIFATLGGLALLLFWNADVPVASVPVATYGLVASAFLPSLPLFTFAGYLLVEGGASQRLLRAYNALFGWLPGGLTITTAVACAIFTFAGSGVTIISMGGLLLPMLVKARYPEQFSIGLINGSGSLGFLFPPSIPVILYGIRSMTPISTLFKGGFLPGMLMVAMVCAYGVIQGVRHKTERSRFSFKEAGAAVWEAKWEMAVPVLVLVGLFGGLGTIVEAGAITVVYSFVVECFILRSFSLRRDFARVAAECVIVVGGMLLIIGIAVGLTNYLVDAQIPEALTAWVGTHIHSKFVFLLLLNVVLLLKGSFMDVYSAIIVMVPILTPLGESFGIDPVQLGIIFLANLELGYLTPPIGMNLCYSAYRFKQPMTAIYRATLPFYLILCAGVLLVTYVPQITSWSVEWLDKLGL
jgi:tripartite ATP-independent transporter DctM subunit